MIIHRLRSGSAYCLTFFLFLVQLTAEAQRYDYTWLTGYGSKDGIVDSNIMYGITKFNFANGAPSISYDSLGMNFDRAICSMSDRDGNLLFYSNGNYIANQWDEKIVGSDSLSAGYITYNWDPTIATMGQRFSRQIVSIPDADDRTVYYFFNILIDSIKDGSGNFSATSKKLFLNKLRFDMPLNKGIIDIKKKVLIDTFPSSGMALNQHANGRDWWLIGQLSNTTKYYRFLITRDGAERLPDLDVAVHVNSMEEISVGGFSPSGNKYANLTGYDGLTIYDFDRCSGELSNRIDIPMPEIKAKVLLGLSVSFSPNSRFLYVGATDRIYQFDMWAADIPASRDTVAWYDGFYDFQSVLRTSFSNSQLAPDGKIYFATGNATKYYHVIERPDEKGDSCRVRQHSVRLRGFANGIPYYPNYRLGPLVGSPCDTLPPAVGINEIRNSAMALRIYPMPAQTEVTIDYAGLPWSRYLNVQLEITDALGRTVYSSILPQYSAYQKVDVTPFASGSYMVVLRNGEQVISSGKLMKE
jgi:hypothetical protein